MKRIIACLSVAALMVVLLPSVGAKARGPDPVSTPVTIDGIARDNGQPVVGKVIVAWCGDISHFGGSQRTDANGHFVIRTNSVDCPLGAQLSVVAYNDIDPSVVDGLGLAIVHTQTTVNIAIGNFNPVIVPEYEWLSGAAAAITAGGILAFTRRKLA